MTLDKWIAVVMIVLLIGQLLFPKQAMAVHRKAIHWLIKIHDAVFGDEYMNRHIKGHRVSDDLQDVLDASEDSILRLRLSTFIALLIFVSYVVWA